jgi:ATP-binding cassette, subfamily F, member 3
LEGLEEASGGGKELGSGPGDAKRVTFRLPDPPDGAKDALILDNAVVGYGTGLEPLITNAGIKVSRGDRWLIVGPNGAGKSTLLRTLGGNLRLQGGTLAHGEGTRVGYFSQDLAQELPIDATPLAHVLTVARAADPTVTELTARSVLGALGLSGGAAKERRIGDLSGGEKARVALAAFVLRPVNVLLLDEASNHLDTAAIDALTGALRGWQGAVVAVTHNETFADALEPTFVARVENGSMKTRMVTGGTLSKKDFSPNAVATGGVAGAVAKPKKAAESGAKGNQPQMSQEEIAAAEAAAKEAKAAREKVLREARNAPKTIDKIERALAVLDDDIAAIDARLMECGSDVAAAQDIQVEKDAKIEKQALYYAEWERLEEVMMQAEEIAEEA